MPFNLNVTQYWFRRLFNQKIKAKKWTHGWIGDNGLCKCHSSKWFFFPLWNPIEMKSIILLSFCEKFIDWICDRTHYKHFWSFKLPVLLRLFIMSDSFDWKNLLCYFNEIANTFNVALFFCSAATWHTSAHYQFQASNKIKTKIRLKWIRILFNACIKWWKY